MLAAHPDAAIATACHPIDDPAEAFNPNVVKVVLDARGYALYFSRATIPWARDAFAADRATRCPPGLPLYRHYGLYAYRVGFLRAIPTLAPAPIERFEALEQLRALWHGYRIVVESHRRHARAGRRHARGPRARARALRERRRMIAADARASPAAGLVRGATARQSTAQIAVAGLRRIPFHNRSSGSPCD